MTLSDHSERGGSWRELFNRDNRAAVTVFAGGVALFSTNVYVTTSLLPNAVDDIGGEQFYAWAMTTFLIAAVFSSMLVSGLLTGRGARRAYHVALLLFGAGSVAAALAPTMPVLLSGRTLQGLGGGLLAGLGFAVVRQALPERLWKRAFGLMSAMWGVGNVTGPIIGGLFAELGAWRYAFVLLAVAALVIAWLAQRSLPAVAGSSSRSSVAVGALILLALATTAISLSSIVDSGALRGGLMVVAVLLVLGFILRERGSDVRILPAVTYRRGPLMWIYLSLAILAIGSTSEAFLPLFGQRLGGLSPLGAGLLGASLSWGWSAAQIATSGIDRERTVNALRVGGPLSLAVGLAAYAALQADDAGAVRIGLWFVALIVAGSGIGMAFGAWIPAALASTPDPEEAQKAAAGINTVQLIANTFGSALAGVLVTAGGPETLGSARLLGFGYAALAGLGIVIAVHAISVGRNHHEHVGARQ
ncbi:MFS transporter [Nocardioidaceae bacterium SCSIO 66511]|nr:MFS transporter [Nocardioidaceae bacterium SCSIO 66511]